ncbi:hypothetical protein OG912_32455 [Streptomyces sp. NBC_00464]|uniref:hypothetical protein n=1 Tax=Streptomyces sp. NBC_00464 TaxID=2975751 RepID=UPI002E1899C8
MNTLPAHIKLTVPARMIRRGDEFDLHNRTRTASEHAHRFTVGTVHVFFIGGGEAYLSQDRPIDVRRPVRERPCATA